MSFTATAYERKLTELLASYIAGGTDVTDLRPGGVLHSILSAVAINSVRFSEDLNAQVLEGQATAAYNAFGFGTAPAIAASGSMTLFATPALSSAVTIPIGVLFGVPGTTLQFLSTTQITFPLGASEVVVPVRAGAAGSRSNVGAGAITDLITPIPGVTAVSNSRPFTTGRDAQTDPERRQAFADYLSTLHRGTKRSLEVGAATAQIIDAFGVPIEYVTKARVIEERGAATIAIYGAFGTATPALVAQCQAVIDGSFSGDIYVPGYKAAGVRVNVVAANPVPVVVHVLVRLKPGHTLSVVQPLIVHAATAVINRQNIGDDLHINALRTAIGNVSGVSEFILESPVFDLAADPTDLVTLVNFTHLGSIPTDDSSSVRGF